MKLPKLPKVHWCSSFFVFALAGAIALPCSGDHPQVGEIFVFGVDQRPETLAYFPKISRIDAVAESSTIAELMDLPGPEFRDIAVCGASALYALVQDDPGGAAASIVRIDPTNGAQRIITQGYFLNGAGLDIAVDTDGSILVAQSDDEAFLLRVDPRTGIQTDLSEQLEGPGFVPLTLDIAPNGKVYLGGYYGGWGGIGSIVEYQPESLSLNPISIGSFLSQGMHDIAVAANGNIYTTVILTEEGDPWPTYYRAILEVNPQDGLQTVLTSANTPYVPQGGNEIAFDRNEQLLLTTSGSSSNPLIRFDPQVGTVAVVFDGFYIWGMASILDATCPLDIENPSQYYRDMQEVYIAYYGRPADPAGQAWWAGELAQVDGSLESIINQFGTSQEFMEQYSHYTNENLIDVIYDQMFCREPDPAGRAFYLSLLESGEKTLATITLDVLKGAQD